MITDNITCLPEAPLRSAPRPEPTDMIYLLTRIYRGAGLPDETARRCALADFRCSFPQVLTTGE